MADAYSRISLGQIVRILRGKESGSHAIVIAVDGDRTIWIANGTSRPFEHPKKKNIKHIQRTNQISTIVRTSLLREGRVDDAKIRYALNQYQHNQLLNKRKQCKGE